MANWTVSPSRPNRLRESAKTDLCWRCWRVEVEDPERDALCPDCRHDRRLEIRVRGEEDVAAPRPLEALESLRA